VRTLRAGFRGVGINVAVSESKREKAAMSRPKRYPYFVLFIAVVAMGLILDRVTKILASSLLVTGRPSDFIPGIMDFVLVHNTGAAWGMLSGAFWFFICIALAISIAVIIYILWYPRHTWFEVVSLGLIVAGALGNLYDRLAYREVTDFFHTLFIEFPVFNIADSCITVGVVCFAVFLVFSPQSPLIHKTPSLAADEETGNNQKGQDSNHIDRSADDEVDH